MFLQDPFNFESIGIQFTTGSNLLNGLRISNSNFTPQTFRLHPNPRLHTREKFIFQASTALSANNSDVLISLARNHVQVFRAVSTKRLFAEHN